jgi:benzoyl-CoA reductase/2-hydroxyglutaryl-CoA dehydratase subunit BcrC/BadD/HgdB
MSEMIERFAIDGVVFASNRSCKVYAVMQMDLKKQLAENLHMPTVMIDVDHADARKYSEEDAFLQIEAMLESIASKK